VKRFRFVFALFLGCAAPVCSVLATDILTNRGDNSRTGLNGSETVLTPSFVSSPSFGLVYNNPVDGQVYAQPLYVSNQLIIVNGQSQGTHNVLYVATEHDSLYAFDADTGVLYWQTSLLPTGESPVQASVIGSSDLVPEIGITATPVIDKSAGPNGTIFVVAFSTNGSGAYFNRLHAIDLATGHDQLGIGPVLINPAPVIGTSPFNTFNATRQRGRSGLLLLNGIIYTSWGSYGDIPPYSGWIIAYYENSLSQAAVFDSNPNGSPPSSDLPDGSGNGIWQDGTAPAVDSNNNIYFLTGNGPFDTNLTGGFPSNSDYGDSALKLLTPSLSVSDYFTPFDQQTLAAGDTDLGSGAAVVLPDISDTTGTIHHFLVAAGKDSRLYLLDRDNLGKFNSGGDLIYQELPTGTLPGGTWSSATYFNNSVYLGSTVETPGSQGNSIQQLQFDFTNPTKPLLHSVSSTGTKFAFPGATATISSNGTSSGIVWAIEQTTGPAILHAYDATNLGNELYNSSQTQIGGAVKFAVPTVCNGKVFCGTSNSLAVFGLLSQPPPAGPKYVQGNSAVPQTPQTTVTVPYNAAQTAGNLNVVIVGWNDTAARVSSVTDTNGNVYQLAVGPTQVSGALSQSIYYLKNIAAATAGANAVKVTFTRAAAYPDIRILEYSGIDPNNPLDTAVGATGSSATSSSGNLTTKSATDLLVGANIVAQHTNGPGANFSQRLLTNPDGDIAEDRVVTAAGTYSASAPLSGGGWVMQMVAFAASGQSQPPPPPPGPQYAQGNSAVPQTPQTSVTLPYTAAQTTGNLNVVIVGWNDTTAQVSSVTDLKGNVYQLAVGPTVLTGALSQSIYYAKNIAAATAGANAVKVTFSSAAAYPDIRILEYSGINPTNPLDMAVGATGNSGTSSSGNLATSNATDLLVGANIVQQHTTGPGTNFTQRLLTSPDGDIAEDLVVTTTGSYSATAPVSGGGWVMQMVAFRH
jgi:hypothetical protein